jgi:hypothetical protein
METSLRVLGAEHPDTVEMLRECVQLRTQVLGIVHPDTIPSFAALIGWQTEKLDIGASASGNEK